jgi:Transcriptional Coactivator p15 (PC4)
LRRRPASLAYVQQAAAKKAPLTPWQASGAKKVISMIDISSPRGSYKQPLTATPTHGANHDGAEDAPQLTVAVFDKNSQEQVRVLLGTFRGRRLCHVRTFLKHCNGVDHDPPLPTKKGVTIATEKVPALIAALEKVCILEGITDAA